MVHGHPGCGLDLWPIDGWLRGNIGLLSPSSCVVSSHVQLLYTDQCRPSTTNIAHICALDSGLGCDGDRRFAWRAYKAVRLRLDEESREIFWVVGENWAPTFR